jgi:hypothetical protein
MLDREQKLLPFPKRDSLFGQCTAFSRNAFLPANVFAGQRQMRCIWGGKGENLLSLKRIILFSFLQKVKKYSSQFQHYGNWNYIKSKI